MNSFPLAPFLASLSDDDIRLSLYDYDRISMALRYDRHWTITRLKNVLKGWLASDFEQGEVFTRRFNSFFAASLEGEQAFESIDINRALDEVQKLTPAPFMILSISPSMMLEGADDFVLEITGENFSPHALIFIDEQEVPSEFISSEKLTAVIPKLIASSQCVKQVTVRSFDGEFRSNSISLEVKSGAKAPDKSRISISKSHNVVAFVKAYEAAFVFIAFVLISVAGVIWTLWIYPPDANPVPVIHSSPSNTNLPPPIKTADQTSSVPFWLQASLALIMALSLFSAYLFYRQGMIE